MPTAQGLWRHDPEALLTATIAGFGGEIRDGQLELSRTIAECMRIGCHLVAEAPTGSGKSLAYLAPAVASGMRVIVATSTKTLQSQLVESDLPALRAHSGVDFTFALLKGRSNYLCLSKLRGASKPDVLFETNVGRSFSKHLDTLRTFAAGTTTGDRSDLTNAVPDASWAAVTCASAECPGRRQCSDGDECFAELARERARATSILVVNHALYCTDIASGGFVLPEHDVVIVDEAHAFADSATSTFGADLAPGPLERLGRRMARAGVDDGRVDAFVKAVSALDGAVRQRDGRVDVGADAELSSVLLSAAEKLAAAHGKIDTATDDAKLTKQVAAGRLEVLRRVAAPGDGDVVWVEGAVSQRRLRIAPVEVGPVLANALLARRPMIALSATLGGQPPFAPFAERLGLVPDGTPGAWGDDEEDGSRSSAAGLGYVSALTPSSFDWREQGLLYVPNELPDPSRDHARWIEQAGDCLVRLVNAAGGRALVLCTSRANTERFAQLLRERTEHQVLAQGDADTAQLSRRFADDESSVLVGTRSFWAGLDVPGTSCVLVVIDRIPFPSPGEPLNAARRDRAEQRGQNAFAVLDLPGAALILAQGAGRLLRRRDDRGVVAVLDPRLATRDYRVRLLEAVPPFRRSVDLDDACAFLATVTGESDRRAREPVDDALRVRNAVACPECDAAISERCRDANGTMAFPHESRVALSNLVAPERQS